MNLIEGLAKKYIDSIDNDDEAKKRIEAAISDLKDVLEYLPKLKDRKLLVSKLGQVSVDTDDLMLYFTSNRWLD